MEPDLDDLVTSPRALFAHVCGLDYHASRLFLDALAARGHGVHPAVVALALGKDQVLAGQARRLLAKHLERPEHRTVAQWEPGLLVALARHGVHDARWLELPVSVKRKTQTLAAIDGALVALRSPRDGVALLPWLVELARSNIPGVAEPTRAAAEGILGAPPGDDAGIVERLLGPS